VKPKISQIAKIPALTGQAPKPTAKMSSSVTKTSAPPTGLSQMDRDKARKLFDLGKWHADRHEDGVAVERLNDALAIDPDLVSALQGLGAIHYWHKDYAKAIELFNAVLQRDERNTDALRGAKEVYVVQRQYSQAHDVLRRLVALNKKDAKSWLDLGDVLFMMDKRDEARENWQQALVANGSAREVIREARERLKMFPLTGSNSPATPSR